jgi:uncharacterized protein YdaU (DUF1376 family)
MAKHAALMLWTDAWIADTMHLSRCERGTYLDLLVLMWRTPGCRVPNDDAWLARKLRMTPDEVANELRPIIAEFCQSDGNYLWQKRLMHEHMWAGKISKRQSVRAKSRWDNKKDVCHDDAALHASGNASVTVTVPVSKEEKEPRKRGPAKSVLPEGWNPSPESFSSSDAGELEKMRDWERANGARKVDWEATWRNWKRRAAEFQGKGGKINGQTTNVISDFQARWEANTAKQLAERESWEAARGASKNKAN